jgi:hypothetical protein
MGLFGTTPEPGTRISDHPKADVVPGVYYPKRSVSGTLFLTGLAGAILGFALGSLFAPSLAPAIALGMAMTFVAIRTAMFVRRRQNAFAQQDQDQQDHRDSFEKRYEEAQANGDLDRWKDKS